MEHGDQMLISFCNAVPRGLVLGVYDFDWDNFELIEPTEYGDDYSGATGICVSNGVYYVAVNNAKADLCEILTIDHELNIVGRFPMQTVSDPHSMIYHDGGLLITSTGNDAVMMVTIDMPAGKVKERCFWKYNDGDTDSVHINSVCELGGHIYLSMFGEKSGRRWDHNQGYNLGNGKIVDITSGDIIHDGLRHPHSLKAYDGRLVFGESQTGRILESWEGSGGWISRVVAEIPGYVRGLAYSSHCIYIASSARRGISKSTGEIIRELPGNQSATDCRIYQCDLNTNEIISRDLSLFGREIYDIELVPTVLDIADQAWEYALSKRLSLYDDQYLELQRYNQVLLSKIGIKNALKDKLKRVLV